MQSLSDHRHSKGFTGKFRHIIKDPNEGLDYASTLKYQKSKQKQELEDKQYLKSLIQSCKQTANATYPTASKHPSKSIYIIQNLVSDHHNKLTGNPLVEALLKDKQKGNKMKQTSRQLDSPSKTQSCIHKPFNKLNSQPNQTYRVVVKNYKASQEKQFVKYPSSSLLHTNPVKYKEKVQTQDGLLNYSDSEDNYGDGMKSYFNSFKKTNLFKNNPLLRIPLTAQRQGKKRHISLPSGIDTGQCSMKKKYFKQKTFFNDTIVYLKKKTNDLFKVHTLRINDFAISSSEENSIIRIDYANSSLDSRPTKQLAYFDPFQSLISKFKLKKSQSKMTRQSYEWGITRDTIWREASMSSKLYIKCWQNKKDQAAAYIQKVKKIKLASVEQGAQQKSLNTQLTTFKKPQVPKFKPKSQYRKLKTVN